MNTGVREQGIPGFLALSLHSQCHQFNASVTAKMANLWKKESAALQTPREQRRTLAFSVVEVIEENLYQDNTDPFMTNSTATWIWN